MSRLNRIRNAQSVVGVSRETFERMSENGATIRYLPAEIFQNGGNYQASAYVAASEYLTTDIIVPAGSYLNPGDYVVVATMGERSWVTEIHPYSMFSRLVIDFSNGRIGVGNGTTGVFDFGSPGQVLKSGGPSASMYWSAP